MVPKPLSDGLLVAGLAHHLQAGDAQIGILLFGRCLHYSFSFLFCFLLCLGLMGARTGHRNTIRVNMPAHQFNATLANQDSRGLSNNAHADTYPAIPFLKEAKAKYKKLK